MMENSGRRRSLSGLRPAAAKTPKTESATTDAEADALLNQGKKALERQDFNQARKFFRRALAKAPFRSDIKDLLAVALDERPYQGKEVPQAPSEPAFRTRSPISTPLAGKKPRIRQDSLSRLAKPVIAGILLLVLAAGAYSLLQFRHAQTSAARKTTQESPEIVRMIDEAKRASRDGSYVEAITLLEKARKVCHDSTNIDVAEAEVHDRQANVLAEQHDYDNAIVALDKALALQPDNPRYLYDKGWNEHLWARIPGGSDAEKSKSLEKDACANLEHSLKGDPDNVLALWAIGRANAALGDRQSAARYFRHLIQVKPGSSYAQNARNELSQWGLSADQASSSQGAR